MPADALPVNSDPTAAPTSRVLLRRDYRDVLERPLRGTVTIQPADGPSVTVELVDGLLSRDLPPGTYTVTASLRTADGVRAYETTTITLGETQ